jgi:transposase
MAHPSGLTKRKLHVIYLKALGFPHQEIERIARVSADSVTRYLKEYAEGGLAATGTSRIYRPTSSLLPHRDKIKAHFQDHPPHTVAQAAYDIEKLTGIKLSLSACRDFMRKRLGMKCRKTAALPAKADPEKQEAFLENSLEPSPCANMTCYTYSREISEQRGRYDDQPADRGPDARSAGFFRSGCIARSP